MKTQIMIALATMSLLVGAYAKAITSTPKPTIYRFIEVSKTRELESLPPQLQLIYDRKCNEEFVDVIRVEKEVKPMIKAISVGILVKENPSVRCKGIIKDQTADGGHLYSGVAYDVFKIKK